jgi:hypothetical protein
MLHLKTAKLARWQVRLLCWSGGLLWLSGVAWLLLHDYGQVQGEFGPEANPAEPWMMRLHGAAMIAALLGSGSLLVAHVWRGWTYRSQRVLGLALVIILAVLILTGYLLYYAGDDSLRWWVSAVHWIIGIVVLPLFLVHYYQGRRIGSA